MIVVDDYYCRYSHTGKNLCRFDSILLGIHFNDYRYIDAFSVHILWRQNKLIVAAAKYFQVTIKNFNTTVRESIDCFAG